MNGAEFLHRFLHSVEKQKKMWIKIPPWSDMVELPQIVRTAQKAPYVGNIQF